MVQTVQEANKPLVLEAFDILFNRLDYAAAENYWPPNCTQQSMHVAPGRDGLFDLSNFMPPTLVWI
jgi:hypothetical protein